MSIDNPNGEHRIYSLQIGVVIETADPLKLARVRVRVPGLYDEGTGWCWPLGAAGAGGKRRGGKMVPRVGAEVGILCHLGDPDACHYLPGHWGKPGGVSEVPGGGLTPPTADAVNAVGGELTPEDAPLVDVLETESFLISIDERAGEGNGSLFIRSKKSGDNIEYDGAANGWIVNASGPVSVQSKTLISLDAPQVQINGRIVANTGDPI